jgi:hypothetical protein
VHGAAQHDGVIAVEAGQIVQATDVGDRPLRTQPRRDELGNGFRRTTGTGVQDQDPVCVSGHLARSSFLVSSMSPRKPGCRTTASAEGPAADGPDGGPDVSDGTTRSRRRAEVLAVEREERVMCCQIEVTGTVFELRRVVRP